ncbi:MAG TPA: DUF6379 domain-containing protein [Anaerolineales bacterium]|nr:DUF6379 domain-containing protein [Anaerolineales bacterium]
MFDRYIICEHDFRNVVGDQGVVGFQLRTRLPYYRGLGLSMVQDITLVVDGQVIPRDSLSVTVHGNTYSMVAMETAYSDRWEFGEEAVLTARLPGGLAKGLHKVDLTHTLRISYLPFLSIGSDTKVLALAD